MTTDDFDAPLLQRAVNAIDALLAISGHSLASHQFESGRKLIEELRSALAQDAAAESRLASERAKWERELAHQEPVLWNIVNKHGEFARKGLTYEPSKDLVTMADEDWPANAPHRSIPLFTRPAAAQPVPLGMVLVRKELAQNLAILDSYESEYDGRMERYCKGCDAYIDNGKVEHDSDCPTEQLKAMLSASKETPTGGDND